MNENVNNAVGVWSELYSNPISIIESSWCDFEPTASGTSSLLRVARSLETFSRTFRFSKRYGGLLSYFHGRPQEGLNGNWPSRKLD